MPSIQYHNHPFWDFIANLEANGAEHPLFGNANSQSRDDRGRCGPGHRGPHRDEGPPPPPNHEGPPPPPPEGSGPHHPPDGPPPHSPDGGWGDFSFGRPHRGHRGGWGGRRGRGGRHHGGPPFGGGWPAGDFDMSKIAEFIGSQLGLNGSGSGSNNNKEGATSGGDGKDFEPAADVFDTEDAYIVHVSLPGAKKEDVGVNWDSEKSELNVAGVIYRPGSEDFLKTLALDERKVGVFERKVRLGSRASPALVEVDSISAKMEDGILMVTIPKEEKDDFVDVKKVDIQ